MRRERPPTRPSLSFPSPHPRKIISMNAKNVCSGVLAAVLLAPLAVQSARADEPAATYDTLVSALRSAKGNAKAVTKATVGRLVQLNRKTENGSFFFVKVADQTFFTCARKAPGFKGGVVTARVTGYFESEGDGNPVFRLDDCPGVAAVNETTTPTTAAATKGVLVWQGLPKDRPEFDKTVPVTLEGKVTREKSPGGWQYDVNPSGARPVRIVFEGADAFSRGLDALADHTVSVTGAVGTFPGGQKAFDTRQQITVVRTK